MCKRECVFMKQYPEGKSDLTIYVATVRLHKINILIHDFSIVNNETQMLGRNNETIVYDFTNNCRQFATKTSYQYIKLVM